MPHPIATPGLTQRADVFLSYARSDLDMARPLVAALEAEGLSVALDVTHLMPGEAYAERLDALLLSSAKLVFLATPASLASAACHHELDLAAQHAKPVLPVLAESVTKTDLPAALRDVQYLRLEAPDLVPRLTVALRTNLDWERRHASYEEMAARGPSTVIALRRELQEAQDWLAARPLDASPVSAQVRTLIQRSQNRLQRRGRVIFTALATTAVALAGLAIGFFVQWQSAQEMTRVANNQTRLAQDQTALAEARALETRNALGLLYSGEAERLANEFQTDAALLTLLEASEMVAESDTPRIEAAFARILKRAESERRFTVPGDITAFEFGNTLYYQSPSDGGLWRIDPLDGPIRIADWPGRLHHAVQVVPRDGFSVIAATERDGTWVMAYMDPATGRQGPAVTVAPEVSPWPVRTTVDVGPDGVGLVTVDPDGMHPDFPSEPDTYPDSRYFAFDTGRGLRAPLEEARLSQTLGDYPRVSLRVDAKSRGRIRIETDLAPDQGPPTLWLGFDTDGHLSELPDAPPESDTADLEDCLARGLLPDEIQSVALEMHALDGKEIGFYSEPYYSTPQTGHCLELGNEMIFVGSFGTSAGGETLLSILHRPYADGGLMVGVAEQPFYNAHFRPSLLWMESGQHAVTAIGLNEVSVYQALDEYQGLGDLPPREFRFPYRVDQAVLSPHGALIVLERPHFDTTTQALRVTVLDPELVLERDNPRRDERGSPRFEVTLGPGPRELRDSAGQTVFGLPSFLGDYSPVAFPPRPDPERPEILTSIDRRTIERVTRGPDGAWRREPLFVAPRFVNRLTLHPDGDLLAVGMSLGAGGVEARVWSLADRREVAFLGQNYKWMDFRVEDDGSLTFAQTGSAATSVALEEGRARAQAALGPGCRPAMAGQWRSSPCWPGHLQAANGEKQAGSK